jgi:hypothetical protein
MCVCFGGDVTKLQVSSAVLGDDFSNFAHAQILCLLGCRWERHDNMFHLVLLR